MLSGWPNRLFSRSARKPKRRSPVEGLEPVTLSIRRLEERRVLDVSAAFMTATGELLVDVTATPDKATISSDGGNLSITDQGGNPVNVSVDGGGAGTVGLDQIRSVVVRGDAAADQEVAFATELSLAAGLRIDDQIETASFHRPISGVTSQGIGVQAGTIRLGADLDAMGSDIRLGGRVVLISDVTLSGHDVLFEQTLDDDGDPGTGSALEVRAIGVTRFGGEVGGRSPLDSLVTDAAGRTELNADVTASGGTLVFNDPVLLTSSVVLTDAGLTGIRFNSTIDSAADAFHTLELSAENGSILFDGDIGAGTLGDQRLGALIIHRAAGGVIFGEINGVERIETVGTVNVGAETSGIGGVGILFNLSPSGLMTLTTDGGDVRFDSRTTLATDLEIVTQGGVLTFTANAPLNSAFGTLHQLTVNAGSGAVRFNEDLGTRARLRGLRIVRADAGVTFGAADDENPGVSDDGPVEFIFTTGTIEIGSGAVIGGTGVVFNAGAGNTLLILTSGGDVRVNGRTELQSDVELDTSAGGGQVVFTSDAPIDSQPGEANDLTLKLGSGDAAFGAAIGTSQALDELRIISANDARFEASVRVQSLRQTDGSGETRFDGSVLVLTTSGVELTTDSVTINDRFETLLGGPVLIDVTNDITVNALIVTGAGPVTLLADDDITFGSSGAIETTAAVLLQADADGTSDAGSGGAVRMADGSVINAGPGTITIFADEEIRLGRLITTALVTLDSTSGSIVDGGDLGGPDIEASELVLHAATGIGTDNPLDTAVRQVAARNEGPGGVRIANDLRGAALTIGAVGSFSGVSTGPLLSPANLGGDIEVVQSGPLLVEAPVLNFAGGHTALRTVSGGDLVVNRPVQNRGGDGWIMFFSAADLLIRHSLPEPLAEISVENEGAIRGQADGLVQIDKGDTDYVILRTHAERFPDRPGAPTLSAKFQDPARFPPPSDTAFYQELAAELQAIRDWVSPQATNFPPLFDIVSVDQGGSNLDERGRAILRVFIGDAVHLERNWHVTIDWGDGTIENYTIPGNPTASRNFLTAAGSLVNQFPDATITGRFDSGDGAAGIYYFHHTYAGPPDPNDPAKPIPVRAELRYDPRSAGDTSLDALFPPSGSTIFNGIRFFQNGSEEIFAQDADVMTNPGQGAFAFIKIVESVIVPVEARQSVMFVVATTQPTVVSNTGQTQEFVGASFEEEVFEQYRLFLRVVDDVTGVEGDEEYDLPISLLDDPLALFRERRFPNGHYRIHLEELRTGRVRLILEVHIYEGRVVPPNFREGTGERQPGVEQPPQGTNGPANQPAAESPENAAASGGDGQASDRSTQVRDEESPPIAEGQTLLTGGLAVLPLQAAAPSWRAGRKRALQALGTRPTWTSWRARRWSESSTREGRSTS